MRYIFIILFSLFNYLMGQTFTHSGYLYTANGTSGCENVPVKLYKRTTPTITGFTSQTNYNGHSYYRSTASSTWLSAKSACENMGGHLATVSNTSENNFLYNTWPSGWIGYYQDRVLGYTYSEPSGGFRWTEIKVTDGLSADYDVSSYTSGTTLTDITSSINATLYNTPTYSSTGGKYLTFNGSNQYALTNNLSSKLTTTSISVLAWIYPTGNGVIMSELSSASTSSGWHESVIEITGSNTLRVGFWNGTGITQLNTSITLNAWHLVCITYDGTTMKGYLNNVNFGSTNFTRQAAVTHSGTGNQHFAFGLSDATNMGHGGYGAFRLGDIQFFNRAITADEIDRTYNLYAYRYKLNQFTYWNGGEPNNSANEDYTQFVSSGRWNDLGTSNSLPYVIEFDYIVNYTAWTLEATSYTDVNGRYSFSVSTNPSIEYYIQIDLPITSQLLTLSDAKGISGIVLNNSTKTGLDYHRWDLNNDSKITCSDLYYHFGRQSGRFTSWNVLPDSRIYTLSQYNSIKTGNTNLWSTYPGVTSVTITNPTSGGTSNYYIISPGYLSKVKF
jgi:hypothetical protein